MGKITFANVDLRLIERALEKRAQEEAYADEDETNCKNCGAPLTRDGECKYCGTISRRTTREER